MKKVIAFIMILALSVTLFTGCGNNATSENNPSVEANETEEVVADSTEEKIHLRFMYWNKEESLAELTALINESLPNVDFEFQFVDTKSFQTVYKTQMAAGEGPDILCMENIPVEVAAGFALDITDQPFMDNYQPSVLNELAVDGRSYAIPGPSWFGGYFYNKTFFEENGLEIPKTFDEFIVLCEEIEALGVKPLANPIKNPNYLMHYALSYVTPEFLRQEEGMDWDKKYKAGEVKMADTWGPYLETWAQMVEKGFIKEEDLGMDFDQAMDEFVTGKAAMLDSGPWDVEIIKEKNPDMVIDMMPFVGNQGDTGWLFGGPGIKFGINATLGEEGNEEKLQAALDVLELISSVEGQTAYWENNKGGSSYVKGVEFPMPEEFDGCKDVFAEGHIYAPFMVWNPGVFEEFGKRLQAYVAGTGTLQEVMEGTDAKNEEILFKLTD